MLLPIQAKVPPTPAGTSFGGQTVIITGSNAGIGLEAARQLLVLGAARVILAVRSRTRGEEAAAYLRADAEVKAKARPEAVVEVFELDLDDFGSVLAFCARVKEEVSELDVLLNNAGLNVVGYQTSRAGHERVMQVNCYSHFLLTLSLLPLLRSTAQLRKRPSRISFTSSFAQLSNSISTLSFPPQKSTIARLDERDTYGFVARYSDSKVAIGAFAARLADKVPASEVLVNSFCPGMVMTGFDRTLPWYLRPLVLLWRLVMARTVREAARTAVYAVGGGREEGEGGGGEKTAGEETHGKFLSTNVVDPGAKFLGTSEGGDFADRLWSDAVKEYSQLDPSLAYLA